MKLKLKIVKRTPELDCPPATQDLELNTKNRNAAIKAEHIQYGPLNLSDEKYYDRAAEHWNTELRNPNVVIVSLSISHQGC